MTDSTPNLAEEALAALDGARSDVANAFTQLRSELDAVNLNLVTALNDLRTEQDDNESLAATVRSLSAERDALLNRIEELENTGTPTEPTEPPVQPTPRLAFALDYAKIAASALVVMGHYFSPGPKQIDNVHHTVDYYARNFNATNGENGKWVAKRGYYRDRPLPVTPWGSGVDWKLENAKSEVLELFNAGFKGVWLNIMGLSGPGFDTYLKVAQAADELFPNGGFYVSPMVDTNGGGAVAADKPTTERLSAYQNMADRLALFAYKGGVKANGRRPSAWFRPDGKFIFSSFKADGQASDTGQPTGPFQNADRWDEFIDIFEARLGASVAFVAGFLSVDKRSGFYGRRWLVAVGDWGSGTDPVLGATSGSYADDVHSQGLDWMAPVSWSNNRNSQGWFDEQVGTRAMTVRFRRAVAKGADLIQFVTVNDYGEGSSIAATAQHGRYVLDIIAGLIQEAVTGQPVKVLRDAVYIAHRDQLYPFTPSVNPTGAVIKQNTTRSNRTPVQNVADILLFLTAPARVTVTFGNRPMDDPSRVSWDAPAGESSTLVPLYTGEIRVQAARPVNPTTTLKFLDHRSPILVMDAPRKDDAGYMVSGSLVDDGVFDPQQAYGN